MKKLTAFAIALLLVGASYTKSQTTTAVPKPAETSMAGLIDASTPSKLGEIDFPSLTGEYGFQFSPVVSEKISQLGPSRIYVHT